MYACKEDIYEVVIGERVSARRKYTKVVFIDCYIIDSFLEDCIVIGSEVKYTHTHKCKFKNSTLDYVNDTKSDIEDNCKVRLTKVADLIELCRINDEMEENLNKIEEDLTNESNLTLSKKRRRYHG